LKPLLFLAVLGLCASSSTLAASACSDPEGQLVSCHLRINSGPGPKGVAFSPDGRHIWVSLLAGPPSVEVYDVETGEKVHSLTLGDNGAVEIVFSEDGQTAFISQMETALVYEVDVATYALQAQHSTRSTWTKVVEASRDGRWLFASNWVGNDVSRIDRSGQERTRRIRTAKTPRGLYLTEDGERLYVASFGSGKLQRINTQTLAVQDLYQGGAMRHLVAQESTGRLFASDMRRGQILVHQMDKGTTTTLTRTDANPNTIVLSPDGAVIAVSCRGRNNRKSYYLPGPEWGSILLFDTETGRKLDAIVGGNQPTGLDISPDGRWLATTDLLDNRVSLYRLPDSAVLLAGNGGRSDMYKAEMRK
jgi:DNA-binding beta-propeller fold protein YncE